MKNYLISFLFIFLCVASFAQDRIHLKNQEIIECNIKEIGENEISYTLLDNLDLLFSIDKSKVLKVVLETGQIFSFVDKLDDPMLYVGQNKTAWKVGLFSPAFGALSVGYERSLRPGKSLDAGLGLIGLGEQLTDNESRGAYGRVGFKFINTPDYVIQGMKRSHILKGWYFKPEIIFASYDRNFYVYNPQNGSNDTKRKNVIAGSFDVCFGKQIVMSNIFLIDFFVGAGYGFDNITSADYGPYDYYLGPEYHYGFTVGGNVPLTFTTGFKIGFLTK